MMEVVYLISRARPSGPINQALNILMGMKENGRVHAVLVTLAPEEENNSWLQRFYDNEIEVVQFMQPLWKTWSCVSMLEKYVKNNKVEVIHSAGYRADFVSVKAKCNAKKVSTQRCLPNEIAEKLPKVIRPVLEKAHLKLIKKMDAVVACSKSLQKVFVKDYNVPALAVQNGVNTEKFTLTTPEEWQSAREKLGLKQTEVMFLVLGSIRPRKNIKMMVDAFREVNDNRLKAYFVGNGSQLEEMQELTKEDENIIFTGHVNDPSIYLKAADILLSASLAEGLPNSVLEALACGIPVLLSDIEPHKELIEGTEAGMLFKTTSKEELVSTIRLSATWDMNVMSLRARELAVSNFGIRKLAENYENVYNSITK